MNTKRGSRLIVALGLVLGQVAIWAVVGVSLPGCDPQLGCVSNRDCGGLGEGWHCSTEDGNTRVGVCVPGAASNPPRAPEPTPTSTGPNPPGQLTVECFVHPEQGEVPRNVTLEAIVGGGLAPYLIRWDLGESGTVTTTEQLVEKQLIRPLRTVSATVVDSALSSYQKMGSCAVDVRFDPPPLHVGCTATPNSGTAPLDVQFTANPRGCIGPCNFTWDFGDGSPLVTARNTAHTYAGGGDYNARVTLTDAVTGDPLYPQRADVCSTVITVSGAPTPPGSPSPPPGGNHAPHINSITASAPACMGPFQATSTIQCQVDDVDGDDVTVSPSANPNGGVTFAPPMATVPGGSGLATFTLQVSQLPQTYLVTCTPVDEHGLAGQPASTKVTFSSCGGG